MVCSRRCRIWVDILRCFAHRRLATCILQQCRRRRGRILLQWLDGAPHRSRWTPGTAAAADAAWRAEQRRSVLVGLLHVGNAAVKHLAACRRRRQTRGGRPRTRSSYIIIIWVNYEKKKKGSLSWNTVENVVSNIYLESDADSESETVCPEISI